MNEEIIIPIFGMTGSLIVIPALVVYALIQMRKYNNQERLKMIESGANPSDYIQKSSLGRYFTLRMALLFIGFGLGIFLGQLLDHGFDMGKTAYFSMIFLCGGLGLVAAYIIENKKESKGE